MLDHVLHLAMEIPDAALWGAVVTVCGGVPAGAKLLWNYWVNREAAKNTRYKEVLKDKDDIIKLKDDRITELSKDLSRKSDDFAGKVEELLKLAMGKVEEYGEKHAHLSERIISVVAEFTATVKNMEAQADEE